MSNTAKSKPENSFSPKWHCRLTLTRTSRLCKPIGAKTTDLCPQIAQICFSRKWWEQSASQKTSLSALLRREKSSQLTRTTHLRWAKRTLLLSRFGSIRSTRHIWKGLRSSRWHLERWRLCFNRQRYSLPCSVHFPPSLRRCWACLSSTLTSPRRTRKVLPLSWSSCGCSVISTS